MAFEFKICSAVTLIPQPSKGNLQFVPFATRNGIPRTLTVNDLETVQPKVLDSSPSSAAEYSSTYRHEVLHFSPESRGTDKHRSLSGTCAV